MKKLYLSLGLLALWLLASSPAGAQGVAIGYQGRLMEGASPATGPYDIQFKLFDGPVHGAGAQQGPTIIKSAVPLVNGVFTVTLDFEPRVFTGPALWLEVEVRRNGGASFTSLIPRQAVLPVPQAIYAQTAGSLASGTVVANQLNTGGIAPAPGQFLSYNNGNLTWRDPPIVPPSVFSLNGTSAYYASGNVGLGTSTPSTYGHGGTARVLEINNSGTTLHSQAHLTLFSRGK